MFKFCHFLISLLYMILYILLYMISIYDFVYMICIYDLVVIFIVTTIYDFEAVYNYYISTEKSIIYDICV